MGRWLGTLLDYYISCSTGSAGNQTIILSSRFASAGGRGSCLLGAFERTRLLPQTLIYILEEIRSSDHDALVGGGEKSLGPFGPCGLFYGPHGVRGKRGW